MSVQKVFERYVPWLALASVAAIAALVIAVELTNGHSGSRAHQTEHGLSAEQRQHETWTIERRQDGIYEARQTIANVQEHEGAFGTSLTAEEIIALFTIFLVISTAGLWWATFQLGERADKGLRQLERAYIYPVINEGDAQQLGPRLDAIALSSTPEERRRLDVNIGLQNFGKTPGFVLEVTADLYLHDVDAIEPKTIHTVTKPVLGERDSTHDIPITIQLLPGEAATNLIGSDPPRLWLRVIVDYDDVFGKNRTEVFVWRYDRKLRRLVPYILELPRQKD